MFKRRNMILLVSTREDLERTITAYGLADVKDVTDLSDIRNYPNLTRTALGGKLGKLMPAETHQNVAVVFPRLEGESNKEWETRAWSDAVISIMAPSFQNHVAITETSTF